MRLHRFYIGHLGIRLGTEAQFRLGSVELSHQLRHVFRLKPGDHVVLFDGSGSDYECAIAEYGAAKSPEIVFTLVQSSRSRFVPAREVRLCAALVKKDMFEWVAEKATELGVTHIVPIAAERSEKKGLNEERLAKIILEASEQSGRGTIPDVATPMSLAEALDQARASKALIVAFHTESPRADSSFSRAVEADMTRPLYVFIGPEGGWSVAEMDAFHAHGAMACSLGTQVLRAETAAVAALSKVMFG